MARHSGRYVSEGRDAITELCHDSKLKINHVVQRVVHHTEDSRHGNCDNNGAHVAYVPSVSPRTNIYKGLDVDLLEEPTCAEIDTVLSGILLHSPLRGIDPCFAGVLQMVVDVYSLTFWSNSQGMQVRLSFLCAGTPWLQL